MNSHLKLLLLLIDIHINVDDVKVDDVKVDDVRWMQRT